MKHFAIYFLGFLCMTSCNQSTHKTVVNESIREIALPGNTNIATNINSKKIPDDTIPNVIVPLNTIEVISNDVENIKSKIKILSCSSFNKDDVNIKCAKLNWDGLFEVNGRYYIKSTKIKFSKEQSELDDKNQITGWNLTSDIKDKNVILISGASLIKGFIDSSIVPPYLSAPGEKFEFNYQRIKYTLYTTGIKKNRLMYNYKLFLMANVKGHNFNQLLRIIGSQYSFGGTDEMY